MKTKILVLLAAMLFIGLSFTSCEGGRHDRKINEKITELIENEKYEEAMAIAEQLRFGKYTATKRIETARVSSLIINGDYALAADIASERNIYEVYRDRVLKRLPFIYQKNKQDLFVVLSTIQFPNVRQSVDYYYYAGDVSDYNQVVTEYNLSISQVMNLAKNTGDNSLLKQLSEFLKPLYGKHKVKKMRNVYNDDRQITSKETVKDENGKPVMEDVWDDTPTDYSDANRIKKEFGLK